MDFCLSYPCLKGLGAIEFSISVIDLYRIDRNGKYKSSHIARLTTYQIKQKANYDASAISSGCGAPIGRISSS